MVPAVTTTACSSSSTPELEAGARSLWCSAAPRRRSGRSSPTASTNEPWLWGTSTSLATRGRWRKASGGRSGPRPSRWAASTGLCRAAPRQLVLYLPTRLPVHRYQLHLEPEHGGHIGESLEGRVEARRTPVEQPPDRRSVRSYRSGGIRPSRPGPFQSAHNQVHHPVNRLDAALLEDEVTAELRVFQLSFDVVPKDAPCFLPKSRAQLLASRSRPPKRARYWSASPRRT